LFQSVLYQPDDGPASHPRSLSRLRPATPPEARDRAPLGQILNIEVKVELPRVRAQPHGVYLVLPLVLQPDLQYIAGGEVLQGVGDELHGAIIVLGLDSCRIRREPPALFIGGKYPAPSRERVFVVVSPKALFLCTRRESGPPTPDAHRRSGLSGLEERARGVLHAVEQGLWVEPHQQHAHDGAHQDGYIVIVELFQGA